MKTQTLKFLYSGLKRKELSKEQIESKVCQEIFISKIGNNERFSKKIAFKGGLIIDSLSHGQRGYTKDIDFDFVKYPLLDEGLLYITLATTNVYVIYYRRGKRKNYLSH